MTAKKLSIQEVEVHADCTLLKPELHDAEVISLLMPSIKESRKLTVEVRTEQGSLFVLSFLGVRNLACKGFAHQNIISHIMVYSDKDLVGHLKEYAPELGAQSEENYKLLTEDIQKKKFILVDLVSTVGCDIVCLCEKLEIFKE